MGVLVWMDTGVARTEQGGDDTEQKLPWGSDHEHGVWSGYAFILFPLYHSHDGGSTGFAWMDGWQAR